MMVTIENLKVFLAKIKTIFATKDELTNGLSTKANTSHGNHVPTTGTVDNATFLRNDNTWQKVTPSNIGAAPSSHGTHVTYSTTAPSAPGTASAGSASTVARTDHVHPAQTSVSGNAGTATKLQTARTINGTAFDGSANITITAAANGGTSAACSGNSATATKLATARTLTVGNTGKTFDGAGNVSWSLSEIGAAPSSHTHSYIMYTDLSSQTISLNTLNLSSGTPNIAYYRCPTDGGGTNITGRPDDNSKYAFNLIVELIRWASTTDYITKQTYTRGNEKLSYVRYCTNGSWSAWEKIYTSVNKPTPAEIGAAPSSHTHNYAGSSSAGGAATSALACSGNAATATKLQTARTINGTAFDGTGAITTANWGTARTLTVGNTGKSVNGSGNVSWSLSEIGAAPAGFGLGTTCQDKSSQDCNDILVTGFYRGSNMTNKPSGCTQGWIYLLVMSHDNSSWVRQVAYDYGTANQVYTRVKQNGTWTAWVATDTNTWRGVQDNLTSTATDQSLSANQGKVLKGLIDGKANSSHTHRLIDLNSEIFSGGNDLNTYNSSKTWVARTLTTTTNRPADYYTVANFGASSNSNFQLAHSYGNSSTLYVRGRHDTSGNYTPWAKVYTDKNKPTPAEIGALSTTGKAADSDKLDGIDSTGFGRAYGASVSFGGNQNGITTAQFITLITNLGAFKTCYWVARGSWSYANNQIINDTGCGNIHLAGSVVEVIGNSSNYTIRITTPTTSSGGVTNSEFIYINNGSSYNPGWRRVYNMSVDSSGEIYLEY